MCSPILPWEDKSQTPIIFCAPGMECTGVKCRPHSKTLVRDTGRDEPDGPRHFSSPGSCFCSKADIRICDDGNLFEWDPELNIYCLSLGAVSLKGKCW